MRLEKFILGLSLALYGCAPAIAPELKIPMSYTNSKTLNIDPPLPLPVPEIGAAPVPIPSIEFMYADFIESVIDLNYPEDVTGVISIDRYGNKLFELVVVQQFGLDAYVDPNRITEMKQVQNMNLPNWNYVLLSERDGKSGDEFLKLNIGDITMIILGDGSIKKFEVYDFEKATADEAENPRSMFTLDDGSRLDANDLGHRWYLDNVEPEEAGVELRLQVCTSPAERLIISAMLIK